MKFEKKVEVEYLDGSKIMHTFKVLSNNKRNKLYGEYLDMKKFMSKKNKDGISELELIKDDKNILQFMTESLTLSCETLQIDNIPATEGDRLFEELSGFILTGELKN